MTSSSDLQKELKNRLTAFCVKYGYPTRRAVQGVRKLLGQRFIPEIDPPSVAPALWEDRHGDDLELNPIQFFDKYWGEYLDHGVLFQREFREFDKALFQAIRYYCKRQSPPLDYTDHVPPPARRYKTRQTQRGAS
ncbi:MAG TPA: hypothetical protein VJK53_04975 [Candidatus Paceibacterota bacterium]